jgi:curved DNA-binding protein CbpA
MSLTSTEILKITDSYDLFGSLSEADAKEKHRRLSKEWHTDRNHSSDASKVMAHINALYDKWVGGEYGKVLKIEENNGAKRTFHFRYQKSRPTDVGEMYIGKKMVAFRVSEDNMDLFRSAVKAIQSIRFPSKMLEANFNRLTPKELKAYETNDGGVFTVYKGSDQIDLADILEAKVEVEPGHLTWILEGVYNFVLLMHQVQNKMFGGLEPDSVFINPKFRTVHVLGGWWFTETLNGTLKALPNWIIPILPNSIIKAKKAAPAIDQIAIKTLGIRLLGDETMVGSKLLKMGKKYQPLITFLRSPHSESTIKEYGEWSKIVKDLPRLDLPITFNDIYR